MSSAFFADCTKDTLAWAGGFVVNDDLEGKNPLFPPGGPGHRQVFSVNDSPIWRQIANAACDFGSTDWIDVPDLKALVKEEVRRVEGGA